MKRVFFFNFFMGVFAYPSFGYDWSTNPGTGIVEMKRRIEMLRRMFLGCATLLLTLFAVVAADYSGGEGTAEEPYLIGSVADWQTLMDTPNHWNCHFRLIEDLNLQGVVLTPIGRDDIQSFTGFFDGNHHTLHNVTMTTTDSDEYACALFSWVDSGACIENLRLEGVTMSGFTGVAGLAGQAYGRIENCYVQGNLTGNLWVGGLVGYAYDATLLFCETDVTITGIMGGPLGLWTPDYLGGLAGELYESVANSCSSVATITSDYDSSSVGGLIGYAYNSYTAGCDADGNVSGKEEIGGLIGCILYGSVWDCQAATVVQGRSGTGGLIGSLKDSLLVRNCHAAGAVTGAGSTGGLIGQTENSYVFESTAEGHVIGTSNTGGLIGQAVITTLSGCIATGSVEGTYRLGGLAGSTRYGIVEHCTATGTVTGIEDDIGGLIGNVSSTPVTDCCAEGNVTGGYRVGGLIGWADNTMYAKEISSCTATGDVTGLHNEGCIGGLIGRCEYYAVISCSAESVITAASCDHVGGLIGYGGGDVTDCQACVSITGRHYAAGLIGWLYSGSIINCHAVATVQSAGSSTINGLAGLIAYAGENILIRNCTAIGSVFNPIANAVGGLVGALDGGIIDRCYAHVTVTGYSMVGGFVGRSSGAIHRCSATGSVFGVLEAGGFAGLANNNTMSDCYASGEVGSSNSEGPVRDAGGFVGRQNGSSCAERCYATGRVTGSEGRIGGFCARFEDAALVESSFWDTQTSGLDVSAAGTGLSTAEMQIHFTFTDAGWDFVGEDINGVNEIWRMCADGVSYPRLSWEVGQFGDYACPDGVGLDDLEALAMGWLTDDSSPDFNYACDGSGDGVIDHQAMGILSRYWE